MVKVEATGLCRSDWHGWMGHDADIVLPHVPGHELAGTVQAVGKRVTRWKVGDRVTVPFVGGCGHCHECNSGNHQVCEQQFQPGFTAWGSFAEYVALDHAEAGRFLSGLRRRLHRPDAPAVRVYGPEPGAFLGSAHITAGELIADRLLSPPEVQALLQPLQSLQPASA